MSVRVDAEVRVGGQLGSSGRCSSPLCSSSRPSRSSRSEVTGALNTVAVVINWTTWLAFLTEAVRERAAQVEGVHDVDVTLTYDPPWTPDMMAG